MLIGERGKFLLPSTRKVIKAGGLKWLFSRNALHAYVFGLWPRRYLGFVINKILPLFRLKEKSSLFVRHGIARANRSHGKVLTHKHAREIITIDQAIERKDLEQIIPYPFARELILSGPPDVAVYECSCRHSRNDPCQPTQVCMVIGQPFADFVLEHHPNSSRRLTRDEALKLLEEEHGRGHIHSAWFKDILMERFFAICNCCKCCCGGIEAMLKYGVPMIASSGYVSQVDEVCVACGFCEDACPFGAISTKETAIVDWERCFGCGVCEKTCPNGDIRLVRDGRKGKPLDVRVLNRS